MSYEEHYANPMHSRLFDQFKTTPRVSLRELKNNNTWINDEEAIRMGVLLGGDAYYPEGKKETPWIDVRHMQYNTLGDNPFDKFLEINIIDPRRIYLGQSALIDTVRLEVGDVYMVGRLKYPELPETVGHRQVSILYDAPEGSEDDFTPPFDRRRVSFAQPNQIQSHTFIYTEPRTLDPYYSSTEEPPWANFNRKVYDQSESAPTPEPEPTPPVVNQRLVEFIDRHRQEFPALSDADFGFCMAVCDDLKTKYSHDKRILFRQFNIVLHPDAVRHLAPTSRHQVYILGKKLLGL